MRIVGHLGRGRKQIVYQRADQSVDPSAVETGLAKACRAHETSRFGGIEPPACGDRLTFDAPGFATSLPWLSGTGSLKRCVRRVQGHILHRPQRVLRKIVQQRHGIGEGARTRAGTLISVVECHLRALLSRRLLVRRVYRPFRSFLRRTRTR